MMEVNMTKKAPEPTWVYHPTAAAKIVMSDEAKALYKDGWFDSPAKCKDNTLRLKK